MKPVVVLDIDGVMVDGDKPHAVAVQQLCMAVAGRHLTKREYKQTLFMPYAKQWAQLPRDLKDKISCEQYVKKIPKLTNKIIAQTGFEVLPGAAEFVKELFLYKMPIVFCTSGQNKLPRKKVAAVIQEVNKLLPRGIKMTLNDVLIVQNEDLPKSKPHRSAWVFAARKAIEATKHGFSRDGYNRKNFMRHAAIVEDADKVIDGAHKSRAGLVFQRRFMGSRKQPGADIFVKDLNDKRLLKMINAKSLAFALQSHYRPCP